MKFRIVIQQDEDGNYVAECPSLPGCVSQGKTREEALANIKDAIAGYLSTKAESQLRGSFNTVVCGSIACAEAG
ncbi:MAG: type II toxin-antitoxin system HicB family antitoxin [Nitrospirota bacterium]